MITFTYTNETTGFDVDFAVNIKEHAPIGNKPSAVLSEAGDYIDPDIIYHGSTPTTQVTSNAIEASRIAEFNLFELHTRKREFTIDATNVPLIGAVYVGIRLGYMIPKPLHGGRFFTFSTAIRFVRLDT